MFLQLTLHHSLHPCICLPTYLSLCIQTWFCVQAVYTFEEDTDPATSSCTIRNHSHPHDAQAKSGPLDWVCPFVLKVLILLSPPRPGWQDYRHAVPCLLFRSRVDRTGILAGQKVLVQWTKAPFQFLSFMIKPTEITYNDYGKNIYRQPGMHLGLPGRPCLGVLSGQQRTPELRRHSQRPSFHLFSQHLLFNSSHHLTSGLFLCFSFIVV